MKRRDVHHHPRGGAAVNSCGAVPRRGAARRPDRRLEHPVPRRLRLEGFRAPGHQPAGLHLHPQPRLCHRRDGRALLRGVQGGLLSALPRAPGLRRRRARGQRVLVQDDRGRRQARQAQPPDHGLRAQDEGRRHALHPRHRARRPDHGPAARGRHRRPALRAELPERLLDLEPAKMDVHQDLHAGAGAGAARRRQREPAARLRYVQQLSLHLLPEVSKKKLAGAQTA